MYISTIRDIFLRLLENENNEDTMPQLIVQEALRISNDLYGNDVMSSHELAKGYTHPIHPNGPIVVVSDDITAAHETLIAKRKLNLILKSNSIEDIPLSAGDLVQVFIKREMKKRGKWSSSRPIMSFDKQTGIVTVPGSNGPQLKTRGMPYTKML